MLQCSDLPAFYISVPRSKHVLFSLKASAHRAQYGDLGDLSSCQSYFLTYDLETNLLLPSLLPLPLSLSCRQTQFYCALRLHHGATGAAAVSIVAARGQLWVQYGFYYPLTRSPLGQRIAAQNPSEPSAHGCLSGT